MPAGRLSRHEVLPVSASQSLFQDLENAITTALGRPFILRNSKPVGGGCINSAYRLEGDNQSYFVKLNRADLLPMFAAEAEGLREIVETNTVRAPRPLSCGTSGGQAWLVMEHLVLRPGRGDCDRLLGQRLAALHKIEQPYFGWHCNNTIGSTPQPNEQETDWVSFWAGQRLGFQLQLAKSNGYGGRLQRQGEKLLERLPVFFSDYQPRPSLLHGDLWGGNYSADDTGQPVIYDPACYYGDREADMAMTELFGGFGRDFYAAYRDAWPLDVGYPSRKILYNLYHIINHLNLFGGGYLSQAEDMIAQLLAI
jgi:fructosamine-3-kinase